MPIRALKIMVLAGGPDRERPVSLVSGAQVAEALRAAGHEVMERDVGPQDLSCLDEFRAWGGAVIFPVMHGAWGEGGALQRVLDDQGLSYVGCTAAAAQLCMDKHLTKLALRQHGLPTPAFELITGAGLPSMTPPVVVKAPREGSSIDLYICRDRSAMDAAVRDLRHRHAHILVETFIKGAELTVGVISGPGPSDLQALPPIRIVPATEYYDYQAKYNRDDTQYILDPDAIGLPGDVLALVKEQAVRTHHTLGCRHMSRVDFIVDDQLRPWILEINTIPGFTTHSLLPKAAAYAGIPLPRLVDRLVRLAI